MSVYAGKNSTGGILVVETCYIAAIFENEFDASVFLNGGAWITIPKDEMYVIREMMCDNNSTNRVTDVPINAGAPPTTPHEDSGSRVRP